MNTNFYETRLPKSNIDLNKESVRIEILLDIICRRLQLDNTREEKLQSAYSAITSTISKDEFFDLYDALMYAFGSRALNTVVKPHKREEFDLDFAVCIKLLQLTLTPLQLVEKLYECLSNDKNFKGKIEKIRYGIRIVYAGNFHVDIMLGVETDYERLLVPDWKKNEWVIRNPKGFIKWFESKFVLDFKEIPIYEYYRENYPNRIGSPMNVELRAETEEITPAFTYAEVQPIKRITQLVKRHRDMFFQKNMPDFKTKSIILTTLVGDNYSGEVSIYDGMNNFIRKTIEMMDTFEDSSFKLINPADRHLPDSLQENLTDKWEGKRNYYLAFREYLRVLDKNWKILHSKKSIREKTEYLQLMFGENIVKAAYEKLNEEYRLSGLPHDNVPLPSKKLPFILSSQQALASASRNRKPYYGK